MSEPLIQNVSDTAFLIAQYRADESARPDALFRDPLAARLAGDKGKAIGGSFPTAGTTTWLTAIRTVVIDGFIRDAVARGVDTILNLGAGLDTRPYRLELPPTLRWIEVDYAGMIDYKTELLAAETPRCVLERKSVDLADAASRNALLTMINAQSKRILVLTEGVVTYLDLQQAGDLANALRGMEHVESWVVDYVSPASYAYRQRASKEAFANAPFKFEPSDWFAFFAEYGWRVREMKYLPQEGARLGRELPLPRRARIMLRVLPRFIFAKKRRELDTLVGYAVLERADPKNKKFTQGSQ